MEDFVKSKLFEKDNLSRLGSLESWDNYFRRNKFVQKGYLWGIACGAMVTAHKMRLYPNKFLGVALPAGVLTTAAVSTTMICIHAEKINKQLREKLKDM